MINPQIEEALHTPAPFVCLRNLAADLLQQGQARGSVLALFERARARPREAGREADEDVVMEVTDCLVGWCSPHMKL
jgi:hypothetical protein